MEVKKILFIVLVLFGVQTQAQTNGPLCDSIGLSISASDSWYVTLEVDLSNLPVNSLNSFNAEYEWNCCLTCGTNVSADTTSFTSFFTDTLETYSICMSITYSILVANGTGIMCYVCDICDTLTWNNGQWEMLSQPHQGNNITSVQELETTHSYNGKIYDLLGKELPSIPRGKIYIKNGEKYIWK